MKHAFSLIVRFLLSFVVMLIAFMGASSLIGVGSIELTPEETSQSGLALVIVSLVNSFVLSFLILRARWYGATLITAVFVVYFGVETFMSQIETLFFNASVQMGPDVLTRVIASGFLRALIFAPLAVLIWGKLKVTPDADKQQGFSLPTAEWIKRFALLAVAYAVVYILFGYFVAWQSPAVREYYTGTTAVLPFHTHLLNLITDDPVLPIFQLFRGVLWAALALPIVWMTKGKPWQICWAIAFSFAILLSSGLIFPNPYMPAAVREAHLLELSSSMLVYGILAGYVWTRPVYAAPVLQQQAT
jgi:hypothetical protein